MGRIDKLFPNPTVLNALILFVLNPDQAFYLAEIVSKTGNALIQVQRAMTRLDATGLIVKSKKGNRIYYEANRQHPAFEPLKMMLYKTAIYGDVVKTALSQFAKKIEFAFIYGSIAKGSATHESDMDLFIIGQLTTREISDAISELSLQLNREINPSVFSREEYTKKLANLNPYLLEIYESPKIWIIGNDHDFRKMVN